MSVRMRTALAEAHRTGSHVDAGLPPLQAGTTLRSRKSRDIPDRVDGRSQDLPHASEIPR